MTLKSRPSEEPRRIVSPQEAKAVAEIRERLGKNGPETPKANIDLSAIESGEFDPYDNN